MNTSDQDQSRYPPITTLEVGGIWEGPHWEVHRNVQGSGWRHAEAGRKSDSGDRPCPHAFNIREEAPRVYPAGPYGRQHEAVEVTTNWTVPRVVVAYCESGYASTGVCLDCIIDWARTDG